MTIFNAAFGWWTSNPRNSCWDHAEPKSGLAYLIYNLIGQTNTIKDFVCLSDGGHFDNIGDLAMADAEVVATFKF